METSKHIIPKVPIYSQAVFADLVSIIQSFCNAKLNDEYYELAIKLGAKLARKRPSPILSGNIQTWAAGIMHTLGMVNFLFDKSQKPHISSKELAEWFSLSQSTISAKSKTIRSMFRICQMDPDWTRQSLVASNPMIWMIMIDGFVIDIRHAPYELQVAAYEAGIIPYIPEDSGMKNVN